MRLAAIRYGQAVITAEAYGVEAGGGQTAGQR